MLHSLTRLCSARKGEKMENGYGSKEKELPMSQIPISGLRNGGPVVERRGKSPDGIDSQSMGSDADLPGGSPSAAHAWRNRRVPRFILCRLLWISLRSFSLYLYLVLIRLVAIRSSEFL